jgi:hydrogenase maturation protease
MAILVLGVGNSLRRDDAVGLVVVEQLMKQQLTRVDYRTVEGDLLVIPEIIARYDLVVIVDALAPEGNPGRIELFEVTEGMVRLPYGLSLHDLDLIWQLQYIIKNGFTGRIVIVGIQATDLGLGEGLSLQLQANLPRFTATISEMIYCEIEKL